MKAYTIATQERMPREECLALEFLGDVHRDEGMAEEALRYYARGRAIADRIAPQGDLVMELLRREGECLELTGRATRALPILAKARTRAQKLGDRFEEGVILRCLAVASAAIADWDAVRRYLDKSLGILEEIDARHELAITHSQAGRLLSLQADDAAQKVSPPVLLEDAWNHASSAQHLFLKLDIDYWLREVKQVMERIAEQRADEGRYRVGGEMAEPAASAPDRMIAVSAAMRGLLQMCDAFAQYDEAVLITGETGTGKELIARRIHGHSRRQNRPLVAVNVAAIPATMFEREFFGHVRGAFSGADSDRPGFAAEATGGTLFLDEIADLPLELQPKLLRLLQEKTYNSIGDPREKHADVHLIAATNADLGKLVERGRFRQDLYYRLRVLEINIPPLRKRRDDIIPLMDHFLSQAAGRRATVTEYYDEVSIQALRRFRWHGNVREVAMVARRTHICLATEGRVRFQIGMEPHSILLSGPEKATRAAAAGSAIDDITRSRVLVLLEETGNNKSETARRLGISRPTLYRWMQRLGITN